ncbi:MULTISPECIES: MBL fold metallo-hydrolase [unclassified Fusibacter]|uniref:MBL fold metallo-hydrolase n=1 Tax=unclassified Fusibacter TaxID=2624464 RepID=UPI0010115DD8|nr:MULTISPECIES: MBL fold metallo-hydrolase [unclassified Fusibacter]MCK8059465.1 MBL fold metallo-hydrolase [Fusibacter sp. A2]NPE21071.1 MBL fold metallo-hydrolase [Fusibacter sp. A1]RXV62345.1 MBL fold metallo-hydrolase [Fusibacter sp. A1]
MKLFFHGAAGCVTGSNYRLVTEKQTLVIDCGLFQGSVTEEKLNYNPFDYDPATIDNMILTHAHIDHSGRIPKLVKDGFHGKIYCSKGTKDLAEILLLDAAKIQEADTEWENKKRKRAGLEPVEPLYHTDDAYNALSYFYPIPEGEPVTIDGGLTLELTPTGHLLGACSATLTVEGKRITFSGDLGTANPILLPAPKSMPPTDIAICETTYGNRIHPPSEKRIADLIEALTDTLSHGGTAIIPAFSVGRTQQILYDIYSHMKNNPNSEIAKYPIYVDSPLAIDATQIYLHHMDELKKEVKLNLMKNQSPFAPDNLTIVHDMKKSMALNSDVTPKLIISASGMCDAGRIRHHLKHYLWKPNTAIIFVGYQAEGSVGRAILEGEPQIDLLDEVVAIKARIYKLSGYSGHGDQTDLINWLKSTPKLEHIILTHGETDAIEAMRELVSPFAERIDTPQIGDEVELT